MVSIKKLTEKKQEIGDFTCEDCHDDIIGDLYNECISCGKTLCPECGTMAGLCEDCEYITYGEHEAL